MPDNKEKSKLETTAHELIDDISDSLKKFVNKSFGMMVDVFSIRTKKLIEKQVKGVSDEKK
jgi:hypothetical protein